MLSYLKKRWNYLLAKLNLRHEENADPKVQLEQAISDAKDQHRQLREQAANVVANQKQTEMRINEALEKLEKVNANARQAVLMAEEAQSKGDAEKVEQYTSAAQQFADRLLTLEEEIEGLKQMHFQATEAADQAKAAVKQNSTVLQKRLGEKQALLSQARPGQDAGDGQLGHVDAQRVDRRRRAVVQRGSPEDRGPLREGQRGRRAQRDQCRVAHARDRRGRPRCRGPGPARPDQGRPRDRGGARQRGAHRRRELARQRDQIVGVHHDRRRTGREFVAAMTGGPADLIDTVTDEPLGEDLAVGVDDLDR